jgi:hypothetical protein
MKAIIFVASLAAILGSDAMLAQDSLAASKHRHYAPRAYSYGAQPYYGMQPYSYSYGQPYSYSQPYSYGRPYAYGMQPYYGEQRGNYFYHRGRLSGGPNAAPETAGE